jgi:transposase
MGWSVAFGSRLWQDEGDQRRIVPMTVHVCGVDIGKTVFQLVGLSKEGHVVLKKRYSRKQLLTHTVNMPACLIGMETCPGAHFLARALVAQGHE